MTRGPVPALLAAGLTFTLLAGGPAPTAASHADTPDGPSVHSSDGVAGAHAVPLAPGERHTGTRAKVKKYAVAPGLKFVRWDETDKRGTFRAYLLKADLSTRGLSLRYAEPGQVAARDKLTRILRRDGAVAGVNGDFFDIGDTGAPLGVGVDQSSVLHGPQQKWNLSFTVRGRTGFGVGNVPVTGTVKGHPDIAITNVNSPHIYRQSVGLYTRKWGTTPGYAVTEGAEKADLREVVVEGGVVVSNTRRLHQGREIRGRVLIGRGASAPLLKEQLPVGTPVSVRVSAADRPRVAISGSVRLLAEGKVVTREDTELHPRTAVGIDRDTGKVLVLVVDGRQDHSRGVTLLELAELLRERGADDALNLDGGGSSTMVTRRPSGNVRVANRPSDGVQRPVPNGLEFLSRR